MTGFIDTIVHYLQFQVARFFGSLWLFYLIFQNLTVSSYAMYGVVQSFTMFCSLLVGLNTQVTFQKLYSLRRLQKSVNLVVLVVLVTTILLFSFGFWILHQVGVYSHIFDAAVGAPNVIVVFIYIVAFSLHAILVPLLNARQMTFAYGVSTTLPVFITILGMLGFAVRDLNWLLAVVAMSNLAVLLWALITNVSVLTFASYSPRHFRKILAYTFRYTFLSLPTLGSRYLTDLAARSLLLKEKGEIAVAILTFSTSLFAVFRSVEQGFFRAITPFFMRISELGAQQVALTKRIIMYQSIFTVLVFASSPLWIGILMDIFPTKPPAIFSSLILVLMALLTVISYHKNFYLSRVKKNVDQLRLFFQISIAINLCILVGIHLIDISVVKFLLLQITLMTCNLLLVRNVAHKGSRV